MYRRTTRELAFEALSPTLRQAVTTHAATHSIPLDGVELRVWHTRSENPPGEGVFAKLFGRRANPVDPDAEHEAALVLHPTQVLIATAGPTRGSAALSVPLVVASIVRGSGVSARLSAAVPGADDGVTLGGFAGDEGRPGTFFFGLERGAQLDACASAVEAAIDDAKRGASRG